MNTELTTTKAVTTAGARRSTLPRLRRARRFSVGALLRGIPRVLVIGLLVLVIVYPLFWVVMGSFKSQFEFLNGPVWSLPTNFTLDNYISAITEGNIGRYALNSVIAVFPSLALIIALGVPAGFALEKMLFRGRGPLLLLFVAAIMVPGQMILLPLFTVYFNVGITGTLLPLIITYVGSGLPLTVFMMATFFRTLPNEVIEASTLDGAGIFRSFFFVAVPMVRNGIFTISLVQFFFIWNDLLVAVTFSNSTNLQTIQVGLLNFTGEYGTVEYGPLFAAVSLNVVFMLVIFGILNQRIIAGLAAGSVKG